jgi:hypothetical protein
VKKSENVFSDCDGPLMIYNFSDEEILPNVLPALSCTPGKRKKALSVTINNVKGFY